MSAQSKSSTSSKSAAWRSSPTSSWSPGISTIVVHPGAFPKRLAAGVAAPSQPARGEVLCLSAAAAVALEHGRGPAALGTGGSNAVLVGSARCLSHPGGNGQVRWGAAWDPHSWESMETQFARLKRLAATHHFRVGVVGFPVSYQVYASFVDDTPQRELERRVAPLGFPSLDLLPLLRSQPHANWRRRQFGDDDLYFDQCHPRRAANELIGRDIARFVVETFLEGSNRAGQDPESSS
jgi:hypothetical protein